MSDPKQPSPPAKPAAPPGEVFYRLTTRTGPAALEEIRVLDGRVVARRVVEPENVRAVVMERWCAMNDGAG